MTWFFFFVECDEPHATFALGKQGAQLTQEKIYKLSITILANPQIFSMNAKFKLFQKGLSILGEFEHHLKLFTKKNQECVISL